jgi:hypothetical protein
MAHLRPYLDEIKSATKAEGTAEKKMDDVARPNFSADGRPKKSCH